LQDSFVYIQDSHQFDQLKNSLQGYYVVGIDTEFERTKTYWPDLCLVQIATPSEVFIVEPNAFDKPWLESFLINPAILKIFHSCRQDIEAFYAFCGVITQNVFDTQVAAALIDMRDQISYADLCHDIFHIHLSKDFQWSNWVARPLLSEQIAYAANDVRYLIPLYLYLKRKLEDVERQELMRNIMSGYEDKGVYTKDARLYFINKCYHPSLSSDHTHALYRLIEWREQYCQTNNVARRLVFDDKDLTHMSPVLSYEDFLPEHPMREILYQVLKKRHPYEGEESQYTAKKSNDIFPKAGQMGHTIKAVHSKIKKTLEQLKVPMHYIVTNNMIVDFLLDPSYKKNPLFNTWRYDLLKQCWGKLLTIKSKFQTEQNHGKTGYEDIG